MGFSLSSVYVSSLAGVCPVVCISVHKPDAQHAGLLACAPTSVDKNNLSKHINLTLLFCRCLFVITLLPDNENPNRFYVTDALTSEKITKSARIEQIRITVRGKEGEGGWG